MDAVTIYGVSFSTFVRAVRLMCQYKGIAHRLTLAPFGEVIPCFGDEHARLHPFRKLPVLLDGDLVLPETCAIARYLDRKTGPCLFPESPYLNAQVDATANMLAIYVNEALVKGVMLEFLMPKGEGGQVRMDVVELALPKAKAAITWVNSLLESPEYLMTGQFTVCDALLLPMLDYLAEMPESVNFLAEFPALLEYLGVQRNKPYCEGILGAPDLSVLGR